MFSCEIWENFKNTYFEEHLRRAASEMNFNKILKNLSVADLLIKNIATLSRYNFFSIIQLLVAQF